MSETIHINLKAVLNNSGNGMNKLDNLFSKYRADDGSAEMNPKPSYNSRAEMLRLAMEDYLDPTAGMTDAQRERFIKELYAKIQSGRKLTPDEMQYLRRYDPVTYLKVARIQAQREALEKRLKSCNSKEEAQEVYTDAVTRIPEDDPARKELVAAYDRAYEEFKESGDYRALPNEDSDDNNLTLKRRGKTAVV